MTLALYPYLLTDAYLEAADPATVRALGHGISAGLVVHDGERVGGVTADQLADNGFTVESAWQAAGENQHALLRGGEISTAFYDDGPGDLPFAVFNGHWASAATIVYPNLRAGMSRAIGDSVLISVPHRDAMLVFSDRDDAGLSAVQAFVREHEPAGETRLTFGLFRLDASGLRAI